MTSCGLEEAPADMTAAGFQEGFVHVGTALKTDSEPTQLMPGASSLDAPAGYAQTTHNASSTIGLGIALTAEDTMP